MESQEDGTSMLIAVDLARITLISMFPPHGAKFWHLLDVV